MSANHRFPRFIHALLGAATALLLASCTTTGLAPISVAEANSQVVRGYQLAPGDKVKITVFDEENLTGEYSIGSDGRLALPLIAPIPSEGRNSDDIAADLAQALVEGGYVLEPRVAVEVISYRPIFVLGEVSRPGEYEYTGDLTYMQAIAKAGGFSPRADKGKVVLQRQNWPEGRVVNLGSTPLMIAPGDTLIVRESLF